MMRDLKENIEQNHYFAPKPSVASEEGKRTLSPLYPFVISGGDNTERWYFKHISDITEYKFNIFPEYFGNESSYTDEFPKRINKILKNNNDAVIYCVFDLDDVRGDAKKEEKHKQFVIKYQSLIDNGVVILCPSMPCIEYWFLLHFKNTSKLIKTYKDICGQLANDMKFCFDNPTIIFSKLIKKEKNLKDPSWVAKLCADGKLDLAITRAEENIKKAIEANDLNNQSYTFVYRIFKEYNV